MYSCNSEGIRKLTLSLYLKIYVAVLIHVECAEHVVAELHCVPGGEEHLVHVHELGGRQSPVRTVLLQHYNTHTC